MRAFFNHSKILACTLQLKKFAYQSILILLLLNLILQILIKFVFSHIYLIDKNCIEIEQVNS